MMDLEDINENLTIKKVEIDELYALVNALETIIEELSMRIDVLEKRTCYLTTI